VPITNIYPLVKGSRELELEGTLLLK